MLKDKDIREDLFDFLEETYGKVRIIEEKTMGRSRADIVIVTEKALAGIEIKSDADTYTRLTTQVKDYDKFYDYNIAVVGASHGLHIKEHVPDYWGIITVEEVDDTLDFYMLRKPERNPKMKLTNKLKFLWRPELLQIQEKYEMPKYKDKSKDFVIEKICALIPEEELSQTVSDILFERDYSKVKEILTEYRKGELQKKIEIEIDPRKKLELMLQQAEKRGGFSKKIRKKRRR